MRPYFQVVIDVASSLVGHLRQIKWLADIFEPFISRRWPPDQSASSRQDEEDDWENPSVATRNKEDDVVIEPHWITLSSWRIDWNRPPREAQSRSMDDKATESIVEDLLIESRSREFFTHADLYSMRYHTITLCIVYETSLIAMYRSNLGLRDVHSLSQGHTFDNFCSLSWSKSKSKLS